MKKSLICALLCLCLLAPAYAADVSGYEAHAAIDLTPFKDERYKGTFNDMSYSATITMQDMITLRHKVNKQECTMQLRPAIYMTTANSIETFTAYIELHGTSNGKPAGFYCAVGENRYKIACSVYYSSDSGFYNDGRVSVGRGVYAVLKEIAATELPVRLCVVGSDSFYTLTKEDIAVIAQFTGDLESSGLGAILGEDNVEVITQYN